MTFARKTLETFLSRAMLFTISVALSILLARYLGPQLRGELAVVLLIPGLALMMGDFGLGSANIYFASTKKADPENLVSNSLFLGIVGGVLLFLLFSGTILFIQPSLASQLKVSSNRYIVEALAGLPFAFSFSFLSGVILGLHRIRAYNLLSIAPYLGQFVLSFCFLVPMHTGIQGAVMGWVLGWSVALLWALFVLKSQVGVRLGIRFRPDVAYESFRYGLKGYLANISAFLNYRADVFLLALMATPEVVGYYAVAVPIAEVTWNVASAAATILFPEVASAPESQANRLTPNVCRRVLILAVLSSATIAMLAKPIILLLYGKAFLASVRPLILLQPGIVAMSLTKVLSSDLAGRGKPQISAYGASIALALNIVFNLLLIPNWQASGAAVASTISYSFAFLFVFFFFLNQAKVSAGTVLLPRLRDVSRFLRVED